MIKTVFLQKNSNFIVNDKVNLILSCEFYWLRTFDIPINSIKEVISVLPSFFEDFFDTASYSFYAIKLEKHKYLCFAYKQSDIIDAIKKSNLNMKQINGIYFAQNEFINDFEEEKFYKINEIIYTAKDNMIISIPSNLSLNLTSEAFSYENIKLSKNKIYINQSSKYIEVKTSYILSTLFILFSIINFTKTINVNQDISSIENKKEILKKEYKLPASMIQTKSIINEYTSIKNKYDNFTDALAYILKYKTRTNTKLINVSFKNKIIYLKFEDKNKNIISKYISKRYKIISSKSNNNILNMEIKI